MKPLKLLVGMQGYPPWVTAQTVTACLMARLMAPMMSQARHTASRGSVERSQCRWIDQSRKLSASMQ